MQIRLASISLNTYHPSLLGSLFRSLTSMTWQWSERRQIGFVLANMVFLATGCHLFPLGQTASDRTQGEGIQLLPGRYSFRVSQFVFLSDFKVQSSLPIFHELSELREQVFKELRLPPSHTLVKVYLFEDRDKYEDFMKVKYPYLPKRRAFFVAQGKRLGGEDLLVFTYWGDRIHQDLRHELTHALLHSVLKGVPLWLDEGLAEFFEMPPGWNGVNYQHVEELVRGGDFKPGLARLEQVREIQHMTPAEYRESWAWVHWMLRSSPGARNALIDYVQELRATSKPGSLEPRLSRAVPDLEAALKSHLASLDLNKSNSLKRDN